MAYPRRRRLLLKPAASLPREEHEKGPQNRHPPLPAAVPMLLAFCVLFCFFLLQPSVVYAQDRVTITRVREYFPPSDRLPELELYYPQISFGGNPNQLQKANTLMREYAIQEYCAFRQDILSRRRDPPPEAKLLDYRITRNSGGFFSVVFTAEPSPANASQNLQGFTVRLADQKVCRLEDLFLSNTNYASLLDQEISRVLGSPFEGVCHNSPFYLTDSDIVILPGGKGEDRLSDPVPVSLTASAVSRKLAAGLTEGHTDAPSFREGAREEVPGETLPHEMSVPEDG